MGQAPSHPPDRAIHVVNVTTQQSFIRMVQATAVGTASDLRAAMDERMLDYRLSRAALLALETEERGEIERDIDSLSRDDGHRCLVLRRIQFERALCSGALSMGDSLLHIACRRNHVALVRLLLSAGCMEQQQNAAGRVPRQETASETVREEVSAAEALSSLSGTTFPHRSRAKETVKIVRRVWSRWMFAGTNECGPLAACVFGVRPGARFHAEITRLVEGEARRHRATATASGRALARKLLARADGDVAVAVAGFAGLSDADKVEYAAEVVAHCLEDDFAPETGWSARLRSDYVRFMDVAMGEWIRGEATAAAEAAEAAAGAGAGGGGQSARGELSVSSPVDNEAPSDGEDDEDDAEGSGGVRQGHREGGTEAGSAATTGVETSRVAGTEEGKDPSGGTREAGADDQAKGSRRGPQTLRAGDASGRPDGRASRGRTAAASRRGQARKLAAADERAWRFRVCPPGVQIPAICESPDALRAYTGLRVTSAKASLAEREAEEAALEGAILAGLPAPGTRKW